MAVDEEQAGLVQGRLWYRPMSASPDRPHASSLHVAKDSIGFAAAHFSLLGSDRERLHGHNYRVALRLRGVLTEQGTLADFGRLKAALRAECALLDHRMLVPTRAPEVAVEELADGHVELRWGGDRFLLPATDAALLPLRNSTCECLAEHLLTRLRERLGDLPASLEVTVEESPGQGATSSEE